MGLDRLNRIWQQGDRLKYAGVYLKYLVWGGFFVRLMAVIAIHDWASPVDWEYGRIADNLLAGKGFSGSAWFVPEGKTAFMAPLYVYLLYGCRLLFGGAGYAVLQLLQAIVGALSIWLVYRISREVFRSPRVALIAAGMMTIYPVQVYLTTRIHPLVVNSFLLLCAVYAALVARRSMSLREAAILGMVLGVGMLGDPAILSFVPFAVLGILAQVRKGPAHTLRLAACSVLFLCLTVSPWTIRNYLVFQRFIPVKSQLGYILWIGNHEGTTGLQSYLTETGKKTHVNHTLHKSFRKKLAGMSEPDAYNEFGKIAKTYIRENPAAVFRMTLKKAFYYWWFPTWRTCERCFQKGFWGQWHHPEKLFWAPVLVLSLIAMFITRRAWKQWLFLMSAPCGYTLLYAITTVGNNSRYRVPIESIMIVFAAVGLNWLLARLIFKQRVLD